MIRGLKNYINKSEFVKNSLTLLTGTSIAQIIPLAFSPILARLYDPSDFGVLALYMSFAAVLAVFATGRYEMAIMLPKKDEDAINIFSLGFIVSVILSVIILIVVLIFNEEITIMSGNDSISTFLYFLPLSVFSLGVYKLLNYWFNRKDRFKNIAASKIVATSGNTGLALIVGILKKGNAGLLYAWIFGQFSSMLFLIKRMFSEHKGIFKNVNGVKIITLSKRYKKFPLFDTWSELLNVLSIQLPIIIITQFFGDNITGHFSFAYKVLLLPFSLLAFSMGQAFFKKANDMKISGDNISSFTFNVFKKLVLISFIPLIIVGVFGDYIFPVIFGNDWIIAGNYSRIFSIWIFTIFISSPLTSIFAIFERQRTNLIFNFVMFLSRIGVLVSIAILTNDNYLAIFWYVISGFIFRILFLVIIMKIADVKLYKVFFEIIKYTIPMTGILLILRIIILK